MAEERELVLVETRRADGTWVQIISTEDKVSGLCDFWAGRRRQSFVIVDRARSNRADAVVVGGDTKLRL